MLSPKRTNFRKQHRGRIKGKAYRNNKLSFGNFGVQSQEAGWVSARQIEATRRIITRTIKRKGKLWVTIFPDKPITAKVAETRMGTGKGNVEYWVAVVRPGNILFEMAGITNELAKTAIKLAAYKLPLKIRFIEKTKII